jgi:predicted amidohydrolase
MCAIEPKFFPPKPFRMYSVRFAMFICYDIWVHALKWPSCPSLFFLRRNCTPVSLFFLATRIWVHALKWPSCPSLFFLRRNCTPVSLFFLATRISRLLAEARQGEGGTAVLGADLARARSGSRRRALPRAPVAQPGNRSWVFPFLNSSLPQSKRKKHMYHGLIQYINCSNYRYISTTQKIKKVF